MKVLVVYATTEGQTRKITEHIAQHLGEGGHEVRLHDLAGSPEALDLAAFDTVMVVASIHEETHLEAVTIFVVGHLEQLRAMPTLFASVSLSAAFPDGAAEAQSYVDRFDADTGWRPTQILLVAGALRYSEYDYYEREIIQAGVLKGRDIGEIEGDLELTDWDRLTRDVDAFMQSLAR